MTTPTPQRPELFIEKRLPVQLLNEQVNFEHGGNPFHPDFSQEEKIIDEKPQQVAFI
ncbi:hypothetical protein WJM97_10740 [Okeanomitos corallinicola TIOX110]|uniref:Uncharacterized protein n=1 Tax=Okeanomitos corallinicola TIOX110 TaxID=3133117 RepID=A0ABZ2UXG9_9CYAN